MMCLPQAFRKGVSFFIQSVQSMDPAATDTGAGTGMDLSDQFGDEGSAALNSRKQTRGEKSTGDTPVRPSTLHKTPSPPWKQWPMPTQTTPGCIPTTDWDASSMMLPKRLLTCGTVGSSAALHTRSHTRSGLHAAYVCTCTVSCCCCC